MTPDDYFLGKLCIFREARGEPFVVKVALAYSLFERVKLGGWWGSTLAEVTTHRNQYSSMTIKGDPNTVVWPAANDPAWLECHNALNAANEESIVNPAPKATSYYDISIAPPEWATDDLFVGQCGRLRFYAVKP